LKQKQKMYYKRLDFIIFILILLLPIAFISTYLVAVFFSHVEPGFPYISDTGTLPPESCIFGQFLAIGSFISNLFVLFRFKNRIFFEFSKTFK
jgi:DNA damage-regulated autophagy modulator protein 2